MSEKTKKLDATVAIDPAWFSGSVVQNWEFYFNLYFRIISKLRKNKQMKRGKVQS